jgi:hypothetical protein
MNTAIIHFHNCVHGVAMKPGPVFVVNVLRIRQHVRPGTSFDADVSISYSFASPEKEKYYFVYYAVIVKQIFYKRSSNYY